MKTCVQYERSAAFALVAASLSSSLHAQSGELSPTVVTATRTESRADAVLSDVKVITREEIERGTGRTVSELLARLAGVQMSANGGLGKSSSVFIRGTESRHVLLLVDGVRVGSATLGTPNFDNIPIESIERIEVLKGPASALYGSDAVGGVIQIFTREGREGISPYASATVGSAGRRQLSPASRVEARMSPTASACRLCVRQASRPPTLPSALATITQTETVSAKTA